MSYPTTGAEGAVTSWGSANSNATLLSKITPASCRLTVTNETQDITGLDVAAAVMTPGLASWTAEISAMAFATPRIGNKGTVTFSAGGYVLHVEAWEWTITAEERDITEFAGSPGSGPTWRSFRPDAPVKVTGRISARADSATALVTPALIGDAIPTLTLVYGSDVANDQVSGLAVLRELGTTVRKGGITTVEYGFEGQSTWTPAGTNSPLGSSGLGLPLWSQGGAATGALVVSTLVGSKTLTGLDSFWKSITIRCPIGAPVELNVSLRGSGSLTPA